MQILSRERDYLEVREIIERLFERLFTFIFTYVAIMVPYVLFHPLHKLKLFLSYKFPFQVAAALYTFPTK